VFDNLFNIHDISVFAEKIRQGRARDTFKRILRGRADKPWEHTECSERHWWEIPEIRARWNLMMTGDVNTDYFTYFHRRHIGAGRDLKGLALGCGTGYSELELASLGFFESIKACDLSPARIEHARERAAATTYGNIVDYSVGDVFSVELPHEAFDIVMVRQSLHHFSPLESVLERIIEALKPDGWFVFNEFVGPSRFQWTDEQLDAVNGLLARLPERYRVRWKSGTVKRRVYRPGRLSMMLYDSTEAAESSRILPLVERMMRVAEIRGYGGNVLQLLFKDIAHNFMRDDQETKQLLRICFEAEDELLSADGVNDDFAAGICQRRE
jgi:SAM-dependent methyltransferase